MTSSRGWHKSSYSGGSNNNCVEVAGGDVILVRDTQNQELGHLVYSTSAWAVFVRDVKDGRL